MPRGSGLWSTAPAVTLAAAAATMLAVSGCSTGERADRPHFQPDDYSYQLIVRCFCLHGGAAVLVRVVDGRVGSAEWVEARRGGTLAGEPESFQRLTINDVIDAAEDRTADRVDVDWPDGQPYPTRVLVDRSDNGADDEIEYVVSHVEVADP
ncbi:DUF6174 domain-containing protein [Nocardioides panaciterrulae]|uniref:Lipoprotein n=1 Tax=Nocardioides panaciterrulae TaxID=661492 RepID=A0A7Y9E364_9ACTN|nr:DUF6174 domain-containing protein [Nocardioides panaciterrulae]NYD40259.1 hypothetical protein [Nocardioides panaciterrulae]